eukprot:91784-Chlamydomonas_euryale.AAC.2
MAWSGFAGEAPTPQSNSWQCARARSRVTSAARSNSWSRFAFVRAELARGEGEVAAGGRAPAYVSSCRLVSRGGSRYTFQDSWNGRGGKYVVDDTFDRVNSSTASGQKPQSARDF